MSAPTASAPHRWVMVAALAGLIGGMITNTAPALIDAVTRRVPGVHTPEKRSYAAAKRYGRLVPSFELNQGQFHQDVEYAARRPDYTLLLKRSGATFSVPVSSQSRGLSRMEHMDMRFAGADETVRPKGTRLLPGVANYLRGDDPLRWLTGVPTYGAVRYSSLYPGTDAIFRTSKAGILHYDFFLRPGADPGAIRLEIGGAERMWIDGRGSLAMDLGGATVRQERPFVYQTRDGHRSVIAGRFELIKNNLVGFEVGDYDSTRPLVIDPGLTYATGIGGSGEDYGLSVAVDSDSNAVVAGLTRSIDLATEGAAQPDYRGDDGGSEVEPRGDAFVAKLDASGSRLIYATYLGGTDGDYVRSVAVDAQGNAYVTGRTFSRDFSTTPGALDRTCGNDGKCDPVPQGALGNPYPEAISNLFGGGAPSADAFVAKLGPSGTLVYSTYLGGHGTDAGNGIAVDPSGSAYVTGAGGTGFPRTEGAFVAPGAGASCPGFVTKLPSDGSEISYSACSGTGAAIAISPTCFSSCEAYVAGKSKLRKLSSDGSALVYSTDVSSAGDAPAFCWPLCPPYGDDIAVDESGRAYMVSGRKIVALAPNGAVVYVREIAHADLAGIAARGGRVFVSGETKSDNFVTVDPIQENRAGERDAVVVALDEQGNAVFSTFLGGATIDVGSDVVLDKDGGVYVTGTTNSKDFAPGPPSGGANRFFDAFAAKITLLDAPLVRSIEPPSGPPGGGAVVTITGDHLASATDVSFGATPALDFRIESDRKIIAVSPPQVKDESVFVRVSSPAGVSAITPQANFIYEGEGTWTYTGSLNVRRWGHTATSLQDGKILVVGGRGSGKEALASAELYHPLGQMWTSCPSPGTPSGDCPSSLSTARWGHSATLLTDGRVLVAGGMDSAGVLASAEVYDPHTGRWSIVGTMKTARSHHTATLLANGEVLIAGGDIAARDDRIPLTDEAFEEQGLSPTAASELFNPASETFTTTSSMGLPRSGHSALHLPAELGARCGADCGKVIVMGGSGAEANAAAELYDPHSGRWAASGSSSSPRDRHTATLFGGGRVLLAGGLSAPPLDGLEDAVSLRPDGVYVREDWGRDRTTPSAEVYEAPPRTFRPIAGMAVARHRHTATSLPMGKVLVAGGCCELGWPRPMLDWAMGLRSAEAYDASANEWRLQTSMRERRYDHTATLLSADPASFTDGNHVCGSICGTVLVAGGGDRYGPLASAELYTPPPTVTEISSAGGSARGGDLVTLTGTGFTNHVHRVLFGGVAAEFSIDSYDRITARTPALSGNASDSSVPVTVINSGGASSPIAFSYGGAPGAITDLAASPVSSSQIDLTFSAPGNLAMLAPAAQRYEIKQSSSPIDGEEAFNAAPSLCGGICLLAPAAVGETITLSIGDLAPGTTYHFAVRAESNGRELGSISDSVSATTEPATPGAVVDLAPVSVGARHVTLAFSATGLNAGKEPVAGDYVIRQARAPITDDEAFEVARDLCAGPCSFTPGGLGETLTIRIDRLTPATTYFYALRALGMGGRPGPVSNVAVVQTMGERGALPAGNSGAALGRLRIRDLKARGVSRRTIKLHFSAPRMLRTERRPVTNYIVKQSRTPIKNVKTWRRARSLCPVICVFSPLRPGSRIRIRVTDLRPSTRYYYAVRPQVGSGALGPRSNTAKARTR